MKPKTTTDLHWDHRARSEADIAKVNIADTVQRDLELQFIFKHLNPVKGLKRLFGMQTLWEAAKSVLKTAVCGLVLW